MGYARLFKRVRLAPGVTLNLSLHGPSVSFGRNTWKAWQFSVPSFQSFW